MSSAAGSRDAAMSSTASTSARTLDDDVPAQTRAPLPHRCSSALTRSTGSELPPSGSPTAPLLPLPQQAHLAAFMPGDVCDDPRGCSFSPEGELLIGGIGIDGRNTHTGEEGWASPRVVRTRRSNGFRRGRLSAGAADESGGVCLNAAAGFVACSPNNSSAGSCASRKSGSGKALRNAWRLVSRRPTSVIEEEFHAPRPAVSVEDIVERRTCRPISLPDFRAHLLSQRLSAAASTSRVTLEPDISFLGGMPVHAPRGVLDLEAAHGTATDHEKTLTNDDAPVEHTGKGRARVVSPPEGDELDALDFVVAVDRYAREYRSLSAALRARIPELPRGDDAACRVSVSSQVLNKAESRVSISEQPLRKRFNNLVATYVGELGKPDENAATRRTPRLTWMSALGLISEELVRQTLADAQTTTHPDALAALSVAVTAHLDTYVLPAFFESASQNLGTKAKRGRLAVGIVCTVLAIVLSVLLILDPSPLSPHYHTPNAGDRGRVERWYRILTLPLWMAGFGYIIAAWTGVCVWLSLRGNHEPAKGTEEAKLQTPAHLIDASTGEKTILADEELKSEAGGDAAADAAATPGPWLMAPELKALLLYFVPSRFKRSAGADALPRTATYASMTTTPAPAPVHRAERTTSRNVHTPLADPLVEQRRMSPSTSSVLARSFHVPGLPLSVGFVSAKPALDSLPRSPRLGGGTSTAAPSVRSVAPQHKAAGASPRAWWKAALNWTGFATDTEQVFDEHVRRTHQLSALKAMLQCTALSVIATIVVVAIP